MHRRTIFKEKKDLHEPYNHDVVITHLEPDILECEVKWALGSITSVSLGNSTRTKLVEVMEFQLSCFKSSEMMLWKCCTQYVSKFGKLSWKRSVFIPIPKKGNAKESSNYRTIALISHASKVMLKILQARLNSTCTVNIQMFMLDVEKAEEPEFKLPTSAGSSKKQETSRKTSTSALLTIPKPLTVWITTN